MLLYFVTSAGPVLCQLDSPCRFSCPAVEYPLYVTWTNTNQNKPWVEALESKVFAQRQRLSFERITEEELDDQFACTGVDRRTGFKVYTCKFVFPHRKEIDRKLTKCLLFSLFQRQEYEPTNALCDMESVEPQPVFQMCREPDVSVGGNKLFASKEYGFSATCVTPFSVHWC